MGRHSCQIRATLPGTRAGRLCRLTHRGVLWFLPLLLSALLAPSCRSPSESGRQREPWDGVGDPAAIPGIPPLRRPAWYNFYERGVALAMKGHWALAARDFLTATGEIPGAAYGKDREMRRAKTYGMHFLEDYFPHREAGVCLFYAGDYGRAEGELQTSIAMLPTSRASVYLNRVREARLKNAGVRLDPEAIRFALESPGDSGYANTSRLAVRGTISSRYWISDVRVNGVRLFVDQAEETYRLSTTLTVPPGPQALTLTATDLAGNVKTCERRFTVDLSAPAISLGTVPGTRDAEAEVVVSDDHELARVLINGKPVPSGPDRRRAAARLPVAGLAAVVVEAEDRAGNRARYSGSPDTLGRAPAPARGRAPVLQLACLQPAAGSLALADVARPLHSSMPAAAEPPRLTLSPPVQERTAVTTEEYFLELEVYDRGGIRLAGIRLNDGPEDVCDLGETCHTVQLLSRTLPLERDRQNSKPTENVLVLRAEDCAGRQQEKRLVIVQRPRYDLDGRLRMQADLMPFKATGGPRLAALAAQLHEEFMVALRQPEQQRLNMVRHDPEVFERMKQEIQISHSAMADRVNLTVGTLRVAEWLLRGQVFERPGDGNWEILLEVIDVESALVVAAVDMHFVGYDEADVRYRLAGLVAKLYQVLPAASAPVARAEARKCQIPLGRHDGIREQMRFIFIPAGKQDDPLLAEPITAATAEPAAGAAAEAPGDGGGQPALVEGVVIRTAERECTVEIRPATAAGKIGLADLAVLR
jgi:hypothetical protein